MPARRRSRPRSASPQIRSCGSGCPPSRPRRYVDKIPIGYAVTYIYGTIGSAIVLAKLGPWLLGIDLPQACADYEKQMGAGGMAKTSCRRGEYWGCRALSLEPGCPSWARRGASRGKRDQRAASCRADSSRQRDPGMEARPGPAGRRRCRLSQGGATCWSSCSQARQGGRRQGAARRSRRSDRRFRYQQGDLRQDFGGAQRAAVSPRRVPAQDHAQHGRDPDPSWHRNPPRRYPHSGRQPDPVRCRREDLGYADRPVEATDIAFLGAGILVGGLVGALSYKWGSIPIGLSTSGGALLAGLILGWLRTIHPTFGRIPGPASR